LNILFDRICIAYACYFLVLFPIASFSSFAVDGAGKNQVSLYVQPSSHWRNIKINSFPSMIEKGFFFFFYDRKLMLENKSFPPNDFKFSLVFCWFLMILQNHMLNASNIIKRKHPAFGASCVNSWKSDVGSDGMSQTPPPGGSATLAFRMRYFDAFAFLIIWSRTWLIGVCN